MDISFATLPWARKLPPGTDPACTEASCAIPVFDGYVGSSKRPSWTAQYPKLVVDYKGRHYCPLCNRTYT